MIIIESKRKKPETILKKYPDAILADVTSGAKDGLVKLSPFYPHGGIPVPFSDGYTASCVEAVWRPDLSRGDDHQPGGARRPPQQALRLRDRRDRCPAVHQAPR